MKLRTTLFIIFIMASSYSWGYSSLCKIELQPGNHASIPNGESLNISFEYETDVVEGVRIFLRPITNGELTPSYSASGSPIYTGTGNAIANFTITAGNVHVDAIRVRILNVDQTSILFEYLIPVDYYFGPNVIENLVFNQTKKATFLVGENATFNFDYNMTEAGGARVFLRPFTNGERTSGYAASGSGAYTGNGSSSAFFTISSGTDVIVDAVRITITNADQTSTLLEYFVPVEYHFSTAKVNNVVPTASGPWLANGDQINIAFDYATSVSSGVRIFIRPMTNGELTPSYGASGSPIYSDTGSGTANFTINSGNTVVDHLRIRVMNADQTQQLLEYLVPVRYTFGDVYLSNIRFCPDSPAWLDHGEQIFIHFDYQLRGAASSGVRIFPRPTAGNYAAAGSPLYNSASGSGSSNFTITSGDVFIEKMRFKIPNGGQTEDLLEFYLPVHYLFGNPTVDIDDELSQGLHITGPYPNPLVNQGQIDIKLEHAQQLRLSVHDLSGRELKVLHDEMLSAGQEQSFQFEVSELPAGLYLLKIAANSNTTVRKFIVRH